MAARGLVNGRGPQHKKMFWKVGVYSCLSERFIRDGRDSAKRVVSDTDTPKVLLENGPDRTAPFVLCDKMNTNGLR